MNQATSQDVFVGPYLDGPGVRAKFSRSYYDMTDGFLVRLLCLLCLLCCAGCAALGLNCYAGLRLLCLLGCCCVNR